MSLNNRRRVTDQYRADGCSQTLGKANRDGVEVPDHPRWIDSAGDDRIEHPRAVQMGAAVVSVGNLADCVEGLLLVNRPTSYIGCVLYTNQGALRVVGVASGDLADSHLDVFRRHQSTIPLNQ